MSRTKPQMTYDLHHWKEKPKMIQPKGDGPNMLGIVTLAALVVISALLILHANNN